MSANPTRNQRIWTYFKRYWKWFFAGAIFLVLTNVLGLAIPRQLGQAIETMRNSDGDVLSAGLDAIRRHGLTIIALAIGAGVARIFSRVYIFNAGRLIEYDVRNELYDKLTTLTQSWFASMPTGDLTSRVTNDVNFVRTLFAITILHVINTVLAYGIALEKMVQLNWELTIWCLAPYPVLLIVVRKIVHALFTQTKIVQRDLSTISSKVQENLAGVSVVKTYGLQPRERTEFGKLNQNFLHSSLKLVTIRGGLQATMTLITGIGTLIVLGVGSSMVLDNRITLGEFIEFNGYVVALAFPTLAMGWVFSVWNRGNAAFDRVIEILNVTPTIVDVPSAKTLPPIDGSPCGKVEFRNVTFGYGDEDVLKDVSFTIPAGSTVAIVGRTGGGKTTLVNLLARQFEPETGQILIDDIPLTELALRETRSEIGVVPQDPFLFSMTIGQNIRFGIDALERDDSLHRATPENSLLDPENIAESQDVRIHDALTIAGLGGDLDAFPRGLDTLVGERGITLSGGQKQRVTIARALMMDPRILVLDDALSSVDTQTERVILDHLDTIMRGRTSILVTHRFNALARVDQIFVVERGRIIERGTHRELCHQKGVYSELYEKQRLREELDQ